MTDGSTSVFVKQAPEFIKCFGPEAKLHRERMELEVRYYRELEGVLGAESAKGFLPVIYDFNLENMSFIMEFLGAFELLHARLVETPNLNEAVALSLGDFMGRTHALTHDSIVSEEKAKEFATAYENSVSTTHRRVTVYIHISSG